MGRSDNFNSLTKSPRIGIFIIAYNATNHLSATLSRILPEVYEKVEEIFKDVDKTDMSSEIDTPVLIKYQDDRKRIVADHSFVTEAAEPK